MPRICHWCAALAAALALVLLLGACENKSYDANDIVYANDVAIDANMVAVDENVSVDANYTEHGSDSGDIPNMMADPPLKRPKPPPDTGPPDGSEKGLGSFVDPPEMAVGNDYPLTFVAARDLPGLAEESQGQKLTAPSNIRIAPYMKVTLLKNSNFQVEATSPAEIPVGPDKAANWSWEVRPLRRGVQRLQARVEVLQVRPDQTLEVIDSDTSVVDVTVKVGTWKGFLAALSDASDLGEALTTLFGAWEKALLALVALIGAASGVVYAIRKFGKKEA
jgi:hypothetical protein